MTLHINSFAPKNINFISNLGPYNEPKSAQIFHYWFEDFLAPTPSLKGDLEYLSYRRRPSPIGFL
jgi:hypothetical protein